MEDYIYILIGIIWVVFSVIKGSQKNKQPQYTEDEDAIPERKSTLEEFLEELLPPVEKPSVTYQSYDEEAIAESEDVVPDKYLAYSGMNYYDYESNMNSSDSGLNSRSSLISNEEEEIFEDTQDDLSYFKDGNIFDLRKAVIYSSILERPYK
jgi:hypothetical protein